MKRGRYDVLTAFRRGRLAVAVTAGAAAVIVISPWVAASSPTAGTTPGHAFAFEGRRCLEVSTFVPVVASQAQKQVDPAFRVKEITPGLGLLAVAVLQCDVIFVDGAQATQGPGLISDVGVFIEPPDDSEDAAAPPGAHLYQLWQVSRVEALAGRMSKIGMAGAFVEAASFGSVTDPVIGSVIGTRGTVPWPYSPYELTGFGPQPAPGAGAGENTWWHEGDKRQSVLKISRSATRVASNVGPGTLTMEPGSPLAHITGTSTFVGAVATLYLGSESGDVTLVNLS